MKRFLALFFAASFCAVALHADDEDFSFSVWGQYVKPTTPAVVTSLSGGGVRGQLEWHANEFFSIGVDFGQAALSGGGIQTGFGSLGGLMRFWTPSFAGLNPYLQLGAGYNLFRDAAKNPFGGGFHTQAVIGNQTVLSRAWALDIGVGLDTLDGTPDLVQAVHGRFGLNYRFGHQRRINFNKHVESPLVMGRKQPEPMDTEMTLRKSKRSKGVMRQATADDVVGTTDDEGYTVVLVKKGDSLWKLSCPDGKESNCMQWPLIFRNNRDSIADADLIYPGQKIKIKLKYTAQEVEEGLREAMEADLAAEAEKARAKAAALEQANPKK